MNNDEISESTKLFMNYYDIIKEVRERYDAESRNLFEKFELLVKMVFDEESGWAVKWNPKSDWHSIRKKGWNGENVDIHIEFHIDRNQFMLEDSYKVMIDIEGKDKTLVKDTLFDKIPKNAIEDLKSKDYELLPGHRSVALIYKRFQHSVKLYEVPIEEFTRELMNLKQDWNILISIIDEYVNNKKC